MNTGMILILLLALAAIVFAGSSMRRRGGAGPVASAGARRLAIGLGLLAVVLGAAVALGVLR